MSDLIIPIFIFIIILVSVIKGHNVFSEFIDGAKEGLNTVVKIIPSILLMVVLVTMIKTSGTLNIVTYSLSRPCSFLGIPSEILPLAVMHPISGSGSLALFKEILNTYGPDSYIGRIASVMQGSAETTFYTIAVYYGATKVKDTRHTVFSSLSADLAALIMSIITVKIFFY